MWDTVLRGDTWSGELTNRRKDGSLYEASLTITPVFNKENNIENFVAIQDDITERVKMEENLKKFSCAIEQTADHVVITDETGAIEYVNPEFERFTGYTKEEVIGKNPKILQSGEHDDEFYKDMWDKIVSGKSCRIEFVNKKKNGELFYEEKTISPIRVKVKNRYHLHLVSTGRDVTDRVKLAESQKILIDDLQKALNQIKTLSGLLPICASCKKIRDDKGYWNQIEGYISKHSDAEFTHGICPACAKALYPELYK